VKHVSEISYNTLPKMSLFLQIVLAEEARVAEGVIWK